MKPQHTFIAERKAAQHCQELLRRSPDPAELVPALARLGERLARSLGPAMAALLGGEAPRIAVAAPAEIGETELTEMVGPLAANCLLASPVPGVNLLASIDGAAVLRLVDRAFGGRGDPGGALPEDFALSAELMIQRLELLVATCLGEALAQPPLRSIKSEHRLLELAPFPAGARLAVLRIELSEGAAKPWQLLIALPVVHLPKLLGQGEAGPRSATGAADPAAAPFAELPLPLTATLVDMPISLSALAALAPGMVLPVAVARAVPLSIGGAVLARGTIGAEDDRIAIQLTQIA